MSLHTRARAEGRIHEMNWLDKLSYLVKYLWRPSIRASAEIEAHFREANAARQALPSSPRSEARLAFVGDLMWIRRNWGGFLPEETREKLGAFDGIVGNLETVVSENVPVNELWPDLFVFNSDPRLVTSFTKRDGNSLFAALSFANNHTLDHGEQPALDTLRLLDKLGIPHSGLGQRGDKRWTQFSRNGIRFGFYAATFGLNDWNLLESTSLQLNWIPNLVPDYSPKPPDISEARAVAAEMEAAGVQVKILSLHWGHEFELYPTRRQMDAARELVMAGFDIIAGSHAHVPQPTEIFFVNGYSAGSNISRLDGCAGRARKALVFYSLGNFVSAMFTPLCRVAPLWPVSFYRAPNGAVDWNLGPLELYWNKNENGGRRLEAAGPSAPIERLKHLS